MCLASFSQVDISSEAWQWCPGFLSRGLQIFHIFGHVLVSSSTRLVPMSRRRGSVAAAAAAVVVVVVVVRKIPNVGNSIWLFGVRRERANLPCVHRQ